MKLKQILEAITAEPDAVFNYLGTAAKALFPSLDSKLPKRFKQKKQKTVNYQRAVERNVRCKTCEFFDEKKNTCLKVEGRLNPNAVCDLWEKGT